MRTSSKILLAVVIVAIGILIALSFHHAPLSPQQQIENQMVSAVNAANQHDTGGIMAIISADYHDENGYNVDLLHALIARGLRSTPELHASLSAPQIEVNGDQAISSAFLSVQDQQKGRTLYSQEVTLQWRKEHAHAFLIFPTDVWRVVSASYGSPGEDYDLGL